jgi:transposase
MNVRYRVELSQAERGELGVLLSGGRRSARRLKRAQILLAADAGLGDEEIGRCIGVSGSTVYRIKRRFVLRSLEAALNEEPRPGAPRKLSGKQEALLVATACSKPPTGRACWTLELLAGEMVKLTEYGEISRETRAPPRTLPSTRWLVVGGDMKVRQVVDSDTRTNLLANGAVSCSGWQPSSGRARQRRPALTIPANGGRRLRGHASM